MAQLLTFQRSIREYATMSFLPFIPSSLPYPFPLFPYFLSLFSYGYSVNVSCFPRLRVGCIISVLGVVVHP